MSRNMAGYNSRVVGDVWTQRLIRRKIYLHPPSLVFPDLYLDISNVVHKARSGWGMERRPSVILIKVTLRRDFLRDL